VTFAPTVVTGLKLVPSVERSTANPVSLPALSAQARLTWPAEAAVAVRLLGAAGAVSATATAAEVAGALLRAPSEAVT